MKNKTKKRSPYPEATFINFNLNFIDCTKLSTNIRVQIILVVTENTNSASKYA